MNIDRSRLAWSEKQRLPFGLGYDVDVIEGIIEERKSAEARAERVRPLAGYGGDRRLETQGKNLTLKQRGEDADYLTARCPLPIDSGPLPEEGTGRHRSDG
jgi:hypothetical protein